MRTILAKSFSFLLILCLMLSILFLSPKQAFASQASETIPHVYDDAGLLSTSELSDLEDMCITYGEDAGINIFILTNNDSNAVDGEIYLENFYDGNLDGTYTDSVLLLVDMYHRDVVFEAYGNAQTYLHSQRGDVIIKKVSPYLTNADYTTAFELYIEKSAAYMKDTSDPNYSRDYSTAIEGGNNTSTEESILMNIWLQLGVAIVIGAITVGVMAYNAGGRMTVGGNTYMDQNHSGLIGRRDDYIRTTVTRVRKPKENKSGGGFTGGVSGGGNSHSTSRGGFQWFFLYL